MKHYQRMVEFEWIVFCADFMGCLKDAVILCVFISFSAFRMHVCGDCCTPFCVVVFNSCWPLHITIFIILYLWQEMPRIYFVTCKYSNAHNGTVSRMDTHKKSGIRITIFVGFMDVNRCTKFNYIHFSCDTNTSRRAQ